jgi:hypothetical protein
MPTVTIKTVSGVFGLGTAGLIAHNAFVYHDMGKDFDYFNNLAFLGNDDPIVGTLILLASLSVLYSAGLEYSRSAVQRSKNGGCAISNNEFENKFYKRSSFFVDAAMATLLALAVYGLVIGGLSSYDVDMKGWVSTDMGLNPEHNPTDWHKSLYFMAYSLLGLGMVFGPAVCGKVSKLVTDWWDSLDEPEEKKQRKDVGALLRKANTSNSSILGTADDPRADGISKNNIGGAPTKTTPT